MKRYYFDAPEGLRKGLAILAEDLSLVTAESRDEADVTVSFTEVEENILHLTLSEGKASIVYGGGMTRAFRALGKLALAVGRGEESLSVEEKPLFRTNCTMLHGMPSMMSAKHYLRKLALLGQNAFMLYTEDQYEIEGRPTFGFMKGKYSKKELHELDDYAADLGIELIPCIQTLGHLQNHLHWGSTAPYRDTSSCLLVGAEETYKLIDDMLKTVSECFRTRRVHIGMDETFDLGSGAYLKKNGYRPQKDIYFEHLEKVAEMAKGYGLHPMMWSDMFFHMYGEHLPNFDTYDIRVELPEDIGKYMPEGVQPVFWDYYRPNKDFYAETLRKHEALSKNTMFAGGVWLWSGYAPFFTRSRNFSIPALEACRERGISEVMVTVWTSNFCSHPLALAGIAWYADYDYRGSYSYEGVNESLLAAGLMSYAEFEKAELPEYYGGQDITTNSAMANDPLGGLLDKNLRHTPEEYDAYYGDVEKALEPIATEGYFAPAFNLLRALVRVLRTKMGLGLRIYDAYHKGDREALAAIADECVALREKVATLREEHLAAWLTYNKYAFDFVANDYRYGGVICRLSTTETRIRAYLNGEIDSIEELETERRAFDGYLYGSNFIAFATSDPFR